MKTLITLFLLAIFSLSVNAQTVAPKSQQELNYALVRAKKVQKTGLVLTVVGGASIIGGAILMEGGMFQNDSGGGTVSSVGGYAGIWMIIVGVPVTCIGVPVLCVGSVKRGQAQRNLQLTLVNINTPYNQSQATGVSLKFNF